MKSFFILLTTAFISLTSHAFFDQSRLTIGTAGNTTIRVIVDGKKYSNKNSDIVINNLIQGVHSVKIFILKLQNGKKQGPAQGRNQPDNDQYAYELAFNSKVTIKNRYHTDILINRFGKAFIDEQLMGNNYEDDDWGDDGNSRWNNRPGNYQEQNNQQQISPEVFQQLKQAVNKESFTDTKLSIAKQVISTNWFTTAQVREIMQLFTFDDARLDIAKYAYKYTLDPGSYFTLTDLLSFSNSRDELMNYIKTVK